MTRRRVWVRRPGRAGGTRVELAGLALQGKGPPSRGELARLAQQTHRGTLDPPDRSL
jgi:hypothetical protein